MAKTKQPGQVIIERQRAAARQAQAEAEAQRLAQRLADMDPLAIRAWDLWQKVRQQKPLVQCITNFVSMVRARNGLASS